MLRILAALAALFLTPLTSAESPPPSDAGRESDLVTNMLALRDELQPVPDGEDAWPRYLAIFRDTLGMTTYGDYGATDLAGTFQLLTRGAFGRLYADDFTDPRIAEQLAILERLEPVLDAFRHATNAPNCRAPIFPDEGMLLTLRNTPVEILDAKPGDATSYYSNPTRMLFPHFLRLVGADARASARRGDFERAVDNYRRLLIMSEHAAATPLVLGQRERFRIVDFTLREIRRTVLETDWPVESVDQLLGILDPSVRAYRLGDYFQRSAGINAELVARELQAAIDQGRSKPDWRQLWGGGPNPDRRRHATETYYLAIAGVADMPKEVRVVTIDPALESESEIAVGECRMLMQARDQALGMLAGTRVILKLERHHARTGEWPDALEDIMTREETLEPNSGAPFVFSRMRNGPRPFAIRTPYEADGLYRDEAAREITDRRAPIKESDQLR
jgi:hypothetical protein